jgi:molecular chaperone DnaK
MSGAQKAIGIDLGTTNSCVAVIEHGEPVVIPNNEGTRTTPSVVAFTDDGDRLVGHIARRQAKTNPDRTLYAVKRLIGRRFEDDETEHSIGLVPYQIVASENGDAWVSVEGKSYSPAQISAMILEQMKNIGEAYLGEDITQAIVTVPAYFNDSQRQATKDAGRIAGLDVLRIINEPTAAALAYGMGRKEHERIAVFDLGGGTFDISILELDKGVFVVKATNGDTFLGGEDFDARIIKHLLDEFENEKNINLRGDRVAMQRLKEAAEKAKHELSNVDETDVNLPFLASNDDGPVHLQTKLSRAKMEELVADLIDRIAIPCNQCMTDSGISADGLDGVLLVGGMTRMPRVKEKVLEIFGKEPEKGINPDEVVAIGAAVQASVLQGDVTDVLLLDVTPLTFGIEVKGGIVEPIIPRNTTIPCRKSKVFTTAQDNQDMVRVHVVQGEREMSENNKSLGKVELHGLPPAPRGVPEIEVTFEIDANGIMNVRAKDLGTGKAQSSRVVSSGGLSETEIDDMIDDAESHRSSDQTRRSLAEARNQLDGLIYNTRRSFEEFGSNLSSEDGIAVRDALAAADTALESNDLEKVHQANSALSTTAQILADAIYGSLGDSLGEDLGDDFDDDFDDDDFDDDDFDDDDDDFDDDDDGDGDDEADLEIEDDDLDDQPGT